MPLTRLPLTTGVSGTLPDANAPSGSVLQVVQAAPNVQLNTTSTTFVATGTKVNITPSSTSSKIFVMCTSGLFWVNSTSSTGTGGGLTIYRDSTNINPSGGNQMIRNYRSGTGTSIQSGGCTLSVLDSPSTTSQITYEVYIQSIWNNPSVRWNDDDQDIAIITAMEIAG